MSGSLVLFDIDGTLLLSGGAGVRAMTIAFERVFGISHAFAGISMAGRTDRYLLSTAFTRAQLPGDDDDHTRFQAAYIPCLLEEIKSPGAGRRGVMPGVRALLRELRPCSDVHLALLTGNYEAAAHIKLEHFGLAEYFEWGVYGEEAEDRDELGPIALRRAVERAVPESARAAAVIVGDTPFDIACARAAPARSVAVATGSHSEDELRAAGADVTLGDLSDTSTVMRLLLGGSAWESNPACPQEGSDRF